MCCFSSYDIDTQHNNKKLLHKHCNGAMGHNIPYAVF